MLIDWLINWSKKYLDSHNNAAATDDVHAAAAAAAAAGVVHSSAPVCLGQNTDLPQNSAAAVDDAEEERVRRNDEPGLSLPIRCIAPCGGPYMPPDPGYEPRKLGGAWAW